MPGALTGNINLIVPDLGRLYRVVNNTTGAFTVTLKTAAGSGVLLHRGSLVMAYCDGTDVLLLQGITGAFGYTIDTETGTFNVTAAHGTVLLDASGGDAIAQLPEASDCPGRVYAFKRIDSSGNLARIEPSGSQQIDGEPTLFLDARYDAVLLQSAGNTWHVLSQYLRAFTST